MGLGTSSRTTQTTTYKIPRMLIIGRVSSKNAVPYSYEYRTEGQSPGVTVFGRLSASKFSGFHPSKRLRYRTVRVPRQASRFSIYGAYYSYSYEDYLATTIRAVSIEYEYANCFNKFFATGCTLNG
eukprot:scaffold506650_cov20-Prasinocladus_malaysianus.AAC.1